MYKNNLEFLGSRTVEGGQFLNIYSLTNRFFNWKEIEDKKIIYSTGAFSIEISSKIKKENVWNRQN